MIESKSCSAPGCDRPVYIHHRGLCVMHNARFIKHGSTDDPRPAGFGQKRYHPLWARWRQLIARDDLSPEWRGDFWLYVADVSPKPENSLKMRKLRENEPYGANNFEWTKTPTREETLAYLKAYKTANPDKVRASHFKNKYGITIAQYDEMIERQNGRCAICGNTESRYGNNKSRKRLAVDHDHVTGQVRGLLCHDCNVGAGALKDDPAVLRAAADYIESWRSSAQVKGTPQPPPSRPRQHS